MEQADLSRKLGDKFCGPYYVRRIGPNDTYQLARCSDNVVLPTLVNAEKLRKYYDPDDHRAPPVPFEPAELHDPPDLTQNQQQDPVQNQPPDPSQNMPLERQQPQPHAQEKQTKESQVKKQNPQNGNTQDDSQTAQNLQEDWYEAEKLLRTRGRGKNRQFLVKWVGNHKPSWEPEDNVSEFLITQYFITHTKKGGRRKRQYQFFDKK